MRLERRPFIIGYLVDIDPAPRPMSIRALADGAALGAIDVIANQDSTGIAMAASANSSRSTPPQCRPENATVALNGSGTADAPSPRPLHWRERRASIRLQASLRDIAHRDDRRPAVNVQYRNSPAAPGPTFRAAISPT